MFTVYICKNRYTYEETNTEEERQEKSEYYYRR